MKESKEPIEFHQSSQHTYNGSPKRKKKQKGKERIFEDIMAKIIGKSLQNLLASSKIFSFNAFCYLKRFGLLVAQSRPTLQPHRL